MIIVSASYISYNLLIYSNSSRHYIYEGRGMSNRRIDNKCRSE